MNSSLEFVLWLEAIVASKPSNNTQYMHIYMVIIERKPQYESGKEIYLSL